VLARTSLLAASAVTVVVLGTAAAVSQSGSQPDAGVPPQAVTTPEPTAKTAKKGSHPYQSILIEGRGPVAPLSDAMREDLGTFAEQYGQPLDEVLQRFHGTMEFGALVNDFEADPDSGYVQAAWRLTATATPWIRFTEKPDAATLRRIEAEAPVPVEVQWGAPLADKALVRVSEVIYGAVSDYPGVATAVGGPERDGAIEITYRVKPGATVDPAGLKRQALRAGAKASPTGDVPVEVRLVEDPDLRVEAQ
jgi:hypothetical protein